MDNGRPESLTFPLEDDGAFLRERSASIYLEDYKDNECRRLAIIQSYTFTIKDSDDDDDSSDDPPFAYILRSKRSNEAHLSITGEQLRLELD